MKFTVTGTVHGYGLNEDGQTGFIKIAPDVPNGQAVSPADPRNERNCPLTIRYAPAMLKEQGLLNAGAKIVVEGYFGVFHKDKPQDNGNGQGGYRQNNNGGYKPKPYTNYYFEAVKLSKAG